MSAEGIEDDKSTASTCNNHGGGGEVNMSILERLIDLEDWDGVSKFLKSSPAVVKKMMARAKPSKSWARKRGGRDNNSLSTTDQQLSSLAAVGNFPLHILCCNPRTPVSLINILLELYEEAIRQPGQYGYLPLHYACAAGVGPDTISRLLEVYPAAARCRDEINGSLPLHLAAKHGAPEEALMDVLCVYPEGSFMKDQTGKTPLDYGKLLQNENIRNSVLYVLETAPILVETAKNASMRVEKDYESRLIGMQEAHTEFIRQIELRQEQERQAFMEMEVRFHNELAGEKERNISFAEIILDLQVKEKQLASDVSETENLLKMEKVQNKAREEGNEKELRSILEGALTVDDSCRNQPIVDILNEFAMKYQQQQTELDELKEQEDLARHLSQLLCSRDDEIDHLKRQLSETETAAKLASENACQSEKLHRDTRRELMDTQKENEHLRNVVETQQNQIQEAERVRHIQESRLGTVKNLISSLSYNVDTWSIEDGDWAEDGDNRTQMPPLLPPVAPLSLEGIERVKEKDIVLKRGHVHPSKLAQSFDGEFDENGTCAVTVSSRASIAFLGDEDGEDMSTITTAASPARPRSSGANDTSQSPDARVSIH